MNELSIRSLAAASASIVLLAPSARALHCDDFEFGSGSPFTGTTTIADVDVTLTSTNTEPFGSTSFRDDLSLNPAVVTFTFSRPIESFHLEISFVRPDEYLTGFDIGLPHTLSGTLIESGGRITTSTANDNGFGRLAWSGLSTTSVSFTIDATGAGSIPALALDRFGLVPVENPSIGTAYCSAAPNSTGRIGVARAYGSVAVAANDLTVTACDLPLNAFGYFITSRVQGFVANPAGSSGNLCLGGAIGRFVGPGQLLNSTSKGGFELDIDLTVIPQPTGHVAGQPGETWSFQAWHRDASGGVATSNFTRGLSITLG